MKMEIQRIVDIFGRKYIIIKLPCDFTERFVFKTLDNNILDIPKVKTRFNF